MYAPVGTEPQKCCTFRTATAGAAVASGLPPLTAAAMTHVTALVVVLSLTGAPVAQAACASWCESASMTCCDAPAVATAVADANCTCARAMADSPVMREENGPRHIPLQTAAIPALAGFAIGGSECLQAAVGVQGRVCRRTPPLVLRL